MKGCISISLYGDSSKYAMGSVENVRLAPKIYPGWTVVVHAEKGHYAISKLRALGAEVIEHEGLPGSGGMFWRFLSVDDPRFTHTIIRDADSRLNVRDKAATEAWIDSDKSLHVIRDNPWHLKIPILGGAWGIKNGAFPKLSEKVKAWNHTYAYGDDESFLGHHVWPAFQNTDDFLCHCFDPSVPGTVQFPEHTEYSGFVCEQIAPTFPHSFKAVVLSPEHYMQRRERFFSSADKFGGFLRNKVVWHLGKTAKERVVPSHVDHAVTHPHYYLAGRDHLDILEEAILDGTKYLFVFEDDAVFHPDFEEFVLRAFVALPEDWQALMLGGQPWTDDQRHLLSDETSQALAKVTGCLGMHGILWNRKGMLRAFDHFTYWNRVTIDQAFRGLQANESGFYATARWVVDIDPESVQFGKDK
jgi:hypothetical protein